MAKWHTCHVHWQKHMWRQMHLWAASQSVSPSPNKTWISQCCFVNDSRMDPSSQISEFSFEPFEGTDGQCSSLRPNEPVGGLQCGVQWRRIIQVISHDWSYWEVLAKSGKMMRVASCMLKGFVLDLHSKKHQTGRKSAVKSQGMKISCK